MRKTWDAENNGASRISCCKHQAIIKCQPYLSVPLEEPKYWRPVSLE